MEEIAKQVYAETAYDGVNVGALVTSTGVLCVDVPSYARDARDWAARMHRLSPYPVQQIVLTDSHGDRVLNTRWLNAPITMQYEAAMVLRSYDKRFPQHLLESLSARNPHRGRELSTGPVEHATTNFSGEIVMYRHGNEIVLKSAPGPLKGNCWVILPERGVLFAGDTLVVDTHPIIGDRTSEQWIETLAQLREFGKKNIVLTGRGPILQPNSDELFTAINMVENYVQDMRARILAHVDAGRPREAIVTYIPEFFGRFPLQTLPAEWVRQQIKVSLGNIYDEVQSPVEEMELAEPTLD